MATQIFYISQPFLGKIPNLTFIFFRWVETTNQEIGVASVLFFFLLVCFNISFDWWVMFFFPVEMCFFLSSLDTEVLRRSPVEDQWQQHTSWINHPRGPACHWQPEFFDSTSAWFNSKSIKLDIVHPWNFAYNMAPEIRQSQKETHLPTIIFQGLC